MKKYKTFFRVGNTCLLFKICKLKIWLIKIIIFSNQLVYFTFDFSLLFLWKMQFRFKKKACVLWARVFLLRACLHKARALASSSASLDSIINLSRLKCNWNLRKSTNYIRLSISIWYKSQIGNVISYRKENSFRYEK